MREDIKSRDARGNGPATSPMDGVEDLIGASPLTDPHVRAIGDHEVRERHLHWPETERTRAVWLDWEWRAWGVGQRARATVRRAWQSFVTREHAHGVRDSQGDHLTHATPTPMDEPRVPRP